MLVRHGLLADEDDERATSAGASSAQANRA
jgi:hypothetical protein